MPGNKMIKSYRLPFNLQYYGLYIDNDVISIASYNHYYVINDKGLSGPVYNDIISPCDYVLSKYVFIRDINGIITAYDYEGKRPATSDRKYEIIRTYRDKIVGVDYSGSIPMVGFLYLENGAIKMNVLDLYIDPHKPIIVTGQYMLTCESDRVHLYNLKKSKSLMTLKHKHCGFNAFNGVFLIGQSYGCLNVQNYYC
jgi:hypothetical protein